MLISATHEIATPRASIAGAPIVFQPHRDRAFDAPEPATPARGGLAPWQILRVKAHIESHLESRIRIGDLAALVRLSTGHFSRCFKHSFGVAPLAYLAARRLARARDLMLTTDDPLCRIALDCGFYDQPHLTRMFRRHSGSSPDRWRRLATAPARPYLP